MTSRWTPKVHNNPNLQSPMPRVDAANDLHQAIDSNNQDEKAMSNQGRDWSFFTSPQFSVIAATVLVLISGAVMYDRLDSKVENLRTETKSDVEKATDKIDGNFDKLDAKFDKIDTKFQQMADKIDDGNRELRSILQTKPAATATATTTPAT